MNSLQKGALLAVFGVVGAGMAQAGPAAGITPPELVAAKSGNLTSYSQKLYSEDGMFEALSKAPKGIYRVYRYDGTTALALVDKPSGMERFEENHIAIGDFSEPSPQEADVKSRMELIHGKDGYPKGLHYGTYYIEQISDSDPGLNENRNKLMLVTIPKSREACAFVNNGNPAYWSRGALSSTEVSGGMWYGISKAHCVKVEEGNNAPFPDDAANQLFQAHMKAEKPAP